MKGNELDKAPMPRWTEGAKEQQRLLIQQQRPWMRATGPRSEYGRQVSSRNAVKKKQPLSQQLHSAFTPRCENAEVALDVAFVSHLNQRSDRPLEIGDRVKYTGGFAPTMLACGDSPLEVVGFCQLGTCAIACQAAGGKIIWIYPKDLERCPDGHRKHGIGNQS